ncbi:DNA primase [Roseibacterium sp. SDUM158017]|uniref:DNA primase n=1 Tax=Roseicyclus salinarum TaxID=3036773 RepID=UPI002414FBC2|nr:DNA primase [Roseibacterium sp. SDUM158017]MDG4647411.1 DNA primase [Roseibacterium sp. SDUM158017]
MSLPPGFLDELKTRVSLAQVAGRKVLWDRRKSNQAKGDMWAPCPFHQEKTASFHVEDRKGFYYCFGCHAKGDIVSFVQETENVGFMEAIELLARDAGMTMPARDPKAAEKADRAGELARATEAAVAFFRLQLKTQAATEARAYLQRRGLSQDTLDRFEIGYAPASRNATLQALTGKGIPERDTLEAGIATRPDDGGAPYDAFRDRIVFPIRDARGRCIGFGGRAMDPDARAKYLNSRETPLFDKGRALYNHGPARAAAGKGQRLVVAEGYMDVVALVAAGFEAAVAPLGTAITEEQLQMLWRIAPEPVIALDGDKAGLRAAMRLVDLALPHLGPDRSLSFCILPEGQDPDDLIRARGPQAMQQAIDAAEPLVKLLWRRETEGQAFDTPERRAGLDRRLREAISRIADPSLKRHYGEALNEMRRALFRPPPRTFGRGTWRGRGFAEAAVAPLSQTRTAAGQLSGESLRCALILAALCRYPALIDEFSERLERLEPQDDRAARLAWFLVCTPERDREQLREALSASGHLETLESLEGTGHLRITPFLSGRDDPAAARTCLQEEFAKHAAARALENELSEAAHDLAEAAIEEDSTLAFRLRQAVRGKHAALTPGDDRPAEQFGDTPEARAAFHELLNSAGQAKKS